jgi:hypothetical protein
MRTLCRTVGPRTFFVVADVEPAYLEALRDLEFVEVEDGFARDFPTETPRLDRMYVNFARCAEELITQTARSVPVPWERALLELLRTVKGQDVDWWLAGSAALAARGLDVTPRDFDLITDARGAHRLGELLAEHLVEPVQETQGWVARWFGRAYVHARIEWAGEVDPAVDQPEPADFGPVAAGRLETIAWERYQLRVPPLDLQLAVSERRGLTQRAQVIQRALESGAS